jgi:hypothetical protein
VFAPQDFTLDYVAFAVVGALAFAVWWIGSSSPARS